MKAKIYKVLLTFDTIATNDDEAYCNAWEVVHDISKLAGVGLDIESIERVDNA